MVSQIVVRPVKGVGNGAVFDFFGDFDVVAEFAKFDGFSHEEVPDSVSEGEAGDDGGVAGGVGGRPELDKDEEDDNDEEGAVEGVPDVGELVLQVGGGDRAVFEEGEA